MILDMSSKGVKGKNGNLCNL